MPEVDFLREKIQTKKNPRDEGYFTKCSGFIIYLATSVG